MLGKRKSEFLDFVQVPPRSRPIARYEYVGDEITEDEEVRVYGETIPDEDEDEDDIPIRTLDKFALFNRDSREFVRFDELLTAGDSDDCKLVGVGTVSTFTEDDSDDEDEDLSMDVEAGPGDDAQRLVLSAILEYDAHYVTKDDDGWVFDPKIYIRTPHAWYILLRPSSAYRPYYRSFWTRHRIAHGLITTISVNEDATATDVLRAVNRPPAADCPTRAAFDELAPPISEEALTADDVVAYLMLVLDKLHSEHPRLHRKLLSSKVMQALYPALQTRKPLPPPKRKATRPLKDQEKEVLKHRNPTCITPRVNTVARKLFSQLDKLQVTDIQPHLSDETPSAVRRRRVHLGDPTTMEWVADSETAPHHYSSVVIDGEVYKSGDVVMVEPGQDQDRTRAKNALSEHSRCSSNYLADTKWFCIIAYMFEKVDRSGQRSKHFHAQWLQHGSQTLLQEAAHPWGLFKLNECDDLPLACIYSHCDLNAWPLDEPSPPEANTSGFHVGVTWDSENCALVEIPPAEVSAALSKCDAFRPCVPCGLAAVQKEKAHYRLLPGGGISRDGVDFHVDDFVYLHTPGQMTGLLGIARITEFVGTDGQGLEAKVLHYGRYDTVVAGDSNSWSAHRDNRRLFQTSVITKVTVEQFAGKAFVVCPSSAWEAEAFLKLDDHFYCDLQSESLRPQSLDELEVLDAPGFSSCPICCSAMVDAALDKERLLRLYGPLRGLELFAGAGGLSTGLQMSGAVHTKWAVEFSPSAARTYQANHPDTVVYNQCSNLLLQHATQCDKDPSLKPLRSLDTAAHVDLPPLPKPGEVDFIYGGPPCQSFSLMNHHRDPNDKRSTLVCNMISYVEYYRPAFFLLENVVGILSYRLNGPSKDSQKTEGIKMGVVKFILGSLTTLGYQVHFKVLQAGQHGAPQGRRRVIFLGARRDAPLPKFPLPQHAFPTPVHNVNLPTGELLHPATRMGADEGGHQCAPLPCVTVAEAINDLPRYDWIDPQPLRSSLSDVGSRILEGIARFVACSPGLPKPQYPSGYSDVVPYPSPPLSRYQSWLRAGNGDVVSYHYTRWFASKVVRRVVNVPIRSNAGHEDLPQELRVERCFDNKTGKAKNCYRTMYGRISADGQFVTAMTTIAPNAKGGKVIHPDQKRILTIRECARAQGFPDANKFLSINKSGNDYIADQMRQIGNAVPVPLAHALGKAIGEALYELWRCREEQEHAWRANSPEVQ